MISKMRFSSLKRIAYLLTLLVLPLLSFGNDQSTTLFAKANASYAKSQYKEALSLYQKILKGGEQSAVLYYNMGNASYKLGDLPSALLYYEKAHRLQPNDEDIKVNIRIASSKTTDKIEEVPEFFLTRWWYSFILGLSVHALNAMSIVFLLFGSAFLILYFFAGTPVVKRAGFYAAMLFFVVGLFVVFITGSQVHYFEDHRQAIIFSSPVNVKSAPSDQAKLLFVVHDGTKVNILETKGDWLKISLLNGNEGWIRQSESKEI